MSKAQFSNGFKSRHVVDVAPSLSSALLLSLKTCDSSSSRARPKRKKRSDDEKWCVQVDISCGVGVTLVNSPVCVPLLCLIAPPPRPHHPAPALLMIPRQEAELAWGSKAIFPPFLCRFLLFVAAFHWNFKAPESQWDTRGTISISIKVNKSSAALLGTALNIKRRVASSRQIKLCCIEGNYTKQTPTGISTPSIPPVPTPAPTQPFFKKKNSPQACVCLCTASVSNESLKGIYKATGRLKHVSAFKPISKWMRALLPQICPNRYALDA